MRLIYNGVVLELFEIQSFVRESVYSTDGVDFLYHKHRLTALLHVAPHGVSMRATQVFGSPTFLDTQPNNVQRVNLRSGVAPKVTDPAAVFVNPDEELLGLAPLVQPGAFLTDHELRARLSIPRRRLYITAHDPVTGTERVWIKAPRSDQRVQALGGGSQDPNSNALLLPYSDAANGPTPLRCDVIQPIGEATYMGYLFTIEFNLVPVDPEADKLILSHRWEVTHGSDEDHYLVRQTVGEVIANGELLRGFNQGLDWYRNQFFHPIPLGFVRSVPEVKQSPDGLTIRYVVRDRDPECMFDPGDSGATHLDIQESVNHLTPDPFVSALKLAAVNPLAGAVGAAYLLRPARP